VSGTLVVAAAILGLGCAFIAMSFLARVYEREERLADILDLPWGEKDVDLDAVVQEHSSLVENTIGFAGKVVDQLDAKGALLARLEQARLPVRPGEFVILVASGGVILGALIGVLTQSAWFALAGLLVAPFAGQAYLTRRLRKRQRKFEEQFPEALTLIASSLSAGHTFLRSIQLMCEESEPPLSEEFSRVVHETQLGGSIVDALGHMAQRLAIRDVDWVVQAVRIQQTVGGKLADLLHTLADFIRAREELRREVLVLTAEGRFSAYVLGALPVFLLVLIQALNPGYMDPMFEGWGWFFLAGAFVSVGIGMLVILRMVKKVAV
jgi:tight adherence protein B